MRVQEMAIGAVRPNPRNPRTHSAKQVRQIADSILAFGFTNPLLVSEDGELIAGHGRLEAARELGHATVPVIRVAGLSAVKRRALAIADNRIQENGGWNRERLAIEIPELAGLLEAEGLDVSILGFGPIEIDDLQIKSDRRAAPSQDGIDPRWCEAPVVTTSGDLWMLGNHRLLCADLRSAEDVARLMSGRTADLALLHPAYGAYGKMRDHGSFATTSGEISSPEFVSLLGRTLGAAASVSREGSIHYVCADAQHLGELLAAAQPVYGKPIDVAVWEKTEPKLGALYRSQHELIAVFAVGRKPPLGLEHGRRRVRSNVWHYAEVKSSTDVTVKPLALVTDVIKDRTRRGDLVLDTFGGGTTVLAAERTGRHAFALDAEPQRVDLAVRRWQAATGRNAVHAESGKQFNESVAERSHKDQGEQQ